MQKTRARGQTAMEEPTGPGVEFRVVLNWFEELPLHGTAIA